MSNRKKPKNRRLIRKRAIEQTQEAPMLEVVTAPDGEKTLLKEVPAMVDEEVVGTTLIYDDGSVDVIYNHDISEEAKVKIEKVTEQYRQYQAMMERLS